MKTSKTIIFCAALCAAYVPFLTANAPAALPPQETDKPIGNVETVATLSGPVPVGVAVSDENRIFLSFPRTIDLSPSSVCELKNGKAVPYPSRAVNRYDLSRKSELLVSVQGITVDGKNRLWLLDSGKIKEDPLAPGAAKLVCVDLKTNRIVQKIPFSAEVAGPKAYLNDVRVDLRRGAKGTAYVTDSSTEGPNALIVVDLATGKARRRLNDHPSVKADPEFLASVEGKPLYVRKPGQPPAHDKTGADGLALSADGSRLWYNPNASRHLYSVSTSALADASKDEAFVTSTVKDYGTKAGASDGIEGDAKGRVFLTDYEHGAIVARLPDGTYQTVAHNKNMVWPDSISVAKNGYLYFTSNQLNRRAQFHNGTDLRKKPYPLFRVRVRGGTSPERLR